MPFGKERASSTYPKAGARPQESINKQLVENSDLLINIFGSRIGSPTGKAISGFIEEIEEHLKAGKDVMVFFKHSSDPYEIDMDQFKKVKDFREKHKDDVYWVDYENEEKFKEIFPDKLQLF